MNGTTTSPQIPTVERELEPREQATYDHRTGLYVVMRRFHVWLPPDEALALDFATASGVSIPTAYDLMSSEWQVPFTLWPVTRHAEYLGHDLSAACPDRVVREHCYLTVTYEGHVCMYPPSTGGSTTAGAQFFNGVVASRFEQGTRSEQILVSYDLDAGGLRKSIGPDSEGTNRLIPTCRWLITQNVTEDDYFWTSDVAQSLIGMVNEDGWVDPVYGTLTDPVSGQPLMPDGWMDGVWLYLGPQTAQNRDGTYTLVHQFDYDLHNEEEEAMMTTTAGEATWYAHQYPWYFLNEMRGAVGNIFKIRKQPVGNLQLSTIYRTASANVGQGYLFADLFRSYSG